MIKSSDGRTILREPRAEDVAALQELRNNLELQTSLLSMGRPNSIERVRGWVESIGSDPASVFFVIASGNDEEFAGFIQVRAIDFVHGHGTLGLAVTRASRGAGHGRNALQLIESYLGSTFGIRKIILNVASANERAIRLYLEAGFREVGVLEYHFFHNGTFHGVMIMEKLLDEK
jgi:RimJ/RimL family protein N-acetyltransferase